MKQELAKSIIDDCPNLYRDEDHHFIGVDDGWYDLVRNLSLKLENMIEKLPNDFDYRESYKACQIKEKFGGLRFYMDNATEEMREIISRAESESFKICEVCGSAGKPTKTGWVKTLCEYHTNKRNK